MDDTPSPARLDTSGAQHTADCLHELLRASRQNSPDGERVPTDHRRDRDHWSAQLQSQLEALAAEGREVEFFLRDDDADDDSETLARLVDVALGRNVPINLEVIPATLTEAGFENFDNYKRACPTLIELHQHGWRHVNHESAGKKCEFGPSRDFAAQFEDIANGKARLEEIFQERFFPVFTPPWNRCTNDTLRILERLGFRAISRDRGANPPTDSGLPEIATTLDLYRWRGGAVMKPPEEIIETLLAQMRRAEPVGILLHHKVMDAQACQFLDRMLAVLTEFPGVRFQCFEQLLRRLGDGA